MDCRYIGQSAPPPDPMSPDLPDVLYMNMMEAAQNLTGPLLIETPLERLAAMAKNLCRVSLAILFIKIAELFDPNPAAILVAVVVVLHSDQIRLLRQVDFLMNKATSLFLGWAFSLFGSSSSSHLQLRGWKIFLLLMAFPACIQAGVVMASKTETVSSYSLDSFSPMQQEYASTNVADKPPTISDQQGLSPGGIVLIVIAALAIPFVVWSVLLGPCSPFRRRDLRRHVTVNRTLSAMEANEDMAFVNGYGLLDLRRHRRNTPRLDPGTSEIAFPPRVFIGYSWRDSRHSIGNFSSITGTETAVDSSSSLNLEGRSQSPISDFSSQTETSTNTSTQTVPLQRNQEYDIRSIGALFHGTPVNAFPLQISLDQSEFEGRGHDLSQVIMGDERSMDTPDINNHPLDRASGEGESSEHHAPLHDEDLDEIYQLIARHARPVDLLIPTIAGAASLSGSTAAGSNLEDVNSDSDASLLPADDMPATDTADSERGVPVPGSPGLGTATSLLDRVAAPESRVVASSGMNAMDVADNATAVSATLEYRMAGHDHDRGKSLAKSNTI